MLAPPPRRRRRRGGVVSDDMPVLLATLARVDFLQHDEKACEVQRCGACEVARERRRKAQPPETGADAKRVRRLCRWLRGERPKGITRARWVDTLFAALAQIAPKRFRQRVVELAARAQQDALLLARLDALRGAPLFAAFLRPWQYLALRRVTQRLEEWDSAHTALEASPYDAITHVNHAGRGEQPQQALG